MIVVQRRLFWKIYLTLLASLVAVAVLMGAFWAIVVLGAIMLASARFAIPDTVTGLIGAVLIALSIWASRRSGQPA